MPKEKKKRGRRAEKAQRKAEEAQEEELESHPPQVPDQDQPNNNPTDDAPDSDKPPRSGPYDTGPDGMPFYGLLTDQEGEYFHHADEILRADTFPDESDRTTFLTALLSEAQGKELKLACSQSHSRLLERVVGCAGAREVKKLWMACEGEWKSLVRHRFASHFVEGMVLRGAGIVAEEVVGGVQWGGGLRGVGGAEWEKEDGERDGGEEEEVVASMETLFLFMLNVGQP